MDSADIADRFIEDQVLTSIRKIREHGMVAARSAKPAAGRACEQCGGSIPRARLRAVPGCTRCVKCASKDEREKAGLFTADARRNINCELDDYLLTFY